MLLNKLAKDKYYLCFISTLLNILIIVFIFSRSLKPAYESADESANTLNILSYIFPFDLSDHVVRKAAHFAEFMVLGCFTTITIFTYYRKPFKGIFITMFVCLATAVSDEALQIFSEGRSSQVSDVILDFSGSFTGLIVTSLLITLIYRIFKRRKDSVFINGTN
jgi:VanZ family protein